MLVSVVLPRTLRPLRPTGPAPAPPPAAATAALVAPPMALAGMTSSRRLAAAAAVATTAGPAGLRAALGARLASMTGTLRF